jgi:MFS family permease
VAARGDRLGDLMAVLDTTIVFVALPSIQHGLGMTVASRQWVVTAYTLALAGLLLLGGRLADRFGARNTLLVGVIGFACASAAGGASVDGAMLIAARAVQGAFGAVLVSSTKSLLVTVYTDAAERARVIATFTATLTGELELALVPVRERAAVTGGHYRRAPGCCPHCPAGRRSRSTWPASCSPRPGWWP